MGRDAQRMLVIWGYDKAEYFFAQDWTGRNSLNRLNKLG
jgi:hypothetical protein